MSLSDWTVYINGRSKDALNYEDSLEVLGSVGTAQGFESLWKFRASHETRSAIRVFRGDVLPMWEHPANVDGAQLVASVTDPKPRSCAVFLAIVRGLIAGEIAGAEAVTGVVLSYRPWGYGLSVWLRAGLDADAVNALDRAMLAAISPDARMFFHYKRHEEVKRALLAKNAKRVEPVLASKSHNGRQAAATGTPAPSRSIAEPPRAAADDRAPTRSQRVIVDPEELDLGDAELRTTRVRARRVQPPKSSLAELEARWEKQRAHGEATAEWTYRELAYGIGAFAFSALCISTLGSTAF